MYDPIIEVLRVRHYSRRTEEAYIHCICRYVDLYRHEQRRKLAESDVNRFLTHLAVKQHVAASTQNQALSAILFLYEYVLKQPLERIEGVVREGKGDKDRVTLMPRTVIRPLKEHLRHVLGIHQQDLADGYDIRTVLQAAGLERNAPD